MKQKQEKKIVEEEESFVCTWCGENCDDGCWIAVEDEIVCDACIETL